MTKLSRVEFGLLDMLTAPISRIVSIDEAKKKLRTDDTCIACSAITLRTKLAERHLVLKKKYMGGYYLKWQN